MLDASAAQNSERLGWSHWKQRETANGWLKTRTLWEFVTYSYGKWTIYR
jgi:hypothetical protein